MHFSSARCRLSLKLPTFLWTTALQRCKLINAFGGWIGAFAALAAYAIPISSRTMSFPADSTGSNPSRPPLPKTKQIIALPMPESNRKSENARLRICVLTYRTGNNLLKQPVSLCCLYFFDKFVHPQNRFIYCP